MRVRVIGGALAACLGACGAARAAPSLQIRGAAARVVVIPETRDDILVTVLEAKAPFPLKVTRFGEAVYIDGDVAHHVSGCPVVGGMAGVRIDGRGSFSAADLPRLAIRVPRNVQLTVGDGVSGAIGRTSSLDFATRGCGDWVIATVKGHLRLSDTGSGEVRTGAAGSADLSVAGSGSIAARDIHGDLTAISSGDGDISAASATGRVVVRIAGAGDVRILGGQARDLNISIAGSGSARYGGQAKGLSATVAGSGYVSVSQVSGPVKKQVFGAGEVQVGR
jgi:hypothetical protein